MSAKPRMRLKNPVKISVIRRIFAQFGKHLKAHRRTLITAWICMLFATAMHIIRPWPIKIIFDDILLPTQKSGQQHLAMGHWFSSMGQWVSSMGQWFSSTGQWLSSIGHRFSTDPELLLASVCAAILLIAIFRGLFGYFQTYLLASVGQKVVAQIRNRLYSHIQRLSHSFHDTSHSGDLLLRLTGDIHLLRELLVGSALFLSERSLVLIAMIAIMLWMDWQLTLVAVGVLPLLALTAFRFSSNIRSAAKRQRRKESYTANVISETVSAITVVQAFAREEFQDEQFAKQNKASMKAGLRATKLEANLNRIVDVILAFGTCGVVWFGVQRVMTGVLTPGELLVFLAYLSGMYKPVRKLSALTSRLSKASACGERIMAILETKPDIQDKPGALTAPRLKGGIEFDQVDLQYRAGEPILKSISFKLVPKQTTAFIGPSGAGKSTLAKLLLRFYDPDNGNIFIDGINIRDVTQASLREQIAIVLQEPVLFATSVRDNIAYGKLDASFEEVITAAKAANAHQFIEQLENGYDTVLSERGATLSGGQRQRIAIARALIRNAPIVILDEPMAGLDVDSQHNVQLALKRLMTNKTCLLITHDLETAARADTILMIEQGRIVDHGNHQQLLATNPQYGLQLQKKNGIPLSVVRPI